MSDAAVCAGAEEVLERYAATVFAAAYAMVKNKEDAEDIAQEVFISYVKAKPAFESAVVEAVNRLPKKYRQVIYLYYIEGYATGEIAAILEMPQNTVLSQLARARKLLKTALKGEFDDV